MEVSGQQYFEWCHQLFLEREQECGSGCDYFVRIGGRFTVRIRFSGSELVSPFMRALAHLFTEPVDVPDLTICVWDRSPKDSGLILYPFGRDSERSKRHTVSDIQIGCDLYPSRLNLFSAKRKLGLFFISDIKQYPWYESCRPLRNIIHWWGLTQKLYMMHAACIGTEEGGILIAGGPGAGKSTTALSSLNRALSFICDDLCLIGIEDDKRVFAYSLYGTAKLEHFQRLAELEPHVVNRDRAAGEKFYLYVNESYPGKLLKRTPLSAIVVPKISGEKLSHLSPIPSIQAFQALVGSTSQELGGASADDFFGPFRFCKATPCFSLASGTDLSHLQEQLANLLTQTRRADLIARRQP